MTDPPTRPPVFTLISGSGLDPRRERQLRRSLTSLGATVDASRNDRWNPATTHLVAVGPVPCVKWVCAIASAASVHIVKPAFLEACIAANDVNLDPNLYAVSFALDDPMLLPASMDALWAGRIWAPAYAYWRQRAGDGKGIAPLCNHRVLMLGQLKPRGAAGLAAPSNKIVIDILSSAAAKVVKSVDEDPTFAIIAPGLDPARLPELKRALKSDILCLGSAFLVDLVCRVSADPSHYVMFESQKSLCGPLLDTKCCQSFEGSLPVSSKQLVPIVSKRPRRTSTREPKRRKEDFKSPFSVQGPDDVSMETPAPISKINATAPDQHMKEVLPALETVAFSSKVISPSTPAPQLAPGSPSVEKTPSQRTNDSHESGDALRIRRRVRRRSRNAGLDVKSTLQFDTPVKAKSTVRSSESCGTLERADGKDHSQLFRQTEASKRSEDEGGTETLGRETQHQGHGSTSGTLLEANRKRSALPTRQAKSSNRSSDIVESGLDQREQHRTVDMLSRATASTIPRPNQTRSKGTSIIDVEMFSQADADTNLSTIAVPHDSALLKSRAIQSVEDGFTFVLGVLGGEPSKRDVALLVRTTGSQIPDQESQSSFSEARDVQAAQAPGANVEESPALEEEELLWFDEADGTQCYGTQNERRGRGNTSRDATGDRPGHNGFSGRNEHSRRRDRGGYGDVNVFKIPVPTQRITISQVLQPKFANIQYANMVRAARGNEADDENCQCEVKYIDWVLGAERLIGCSADEMSEVDKGSRDSAVRRVSLSLADSGALSRFDSAGGLNQVEALVLTGICARLLLADADIDPSPILVGELLSLREKQCHAGFDSLEMVLSATGPNSVSLRHRAVATIWSVLTQEAHRRSERKGMWSYFNTTCSSRLDDLFSVSEVSKPEHLPVLRNGLNWILESLLIVGYVHAIQVDFIEDSSRSVSQGDFKDFPENWDLVCQCLEGFSGESGSMLGQQNAAHDVLKGFLCNVAVYLARRVWGVSEKVLGAVSKAISFLSKLRNENCYCSKPALFVSRFQTLSDVNSGREGVMQYLKTSCDCYFFLGWLFATYGQGNAMKRAMGVIRNGSAFAIENSSSVGCSRAINHHIGITLTVADSLASANDNGEYLLCRTLTSKCPRLETVMDRYVAHGKEDDLCWRITVEAITVRCRVLHARGDSVHIYTNWLAQSVVGTFQKVRRSGERRPSSVAQREALRVQESVFTSLALLTLATIQEVTELLHAKAAEGERDAWPTVVLYVERSEINVLNFVKIASDLFSQMRSSPEETTSKSKGCLLCALLSVISNEVKLVAYAFRNKIDGESLRVKLCASDQVKAKFRFIGDSNLENLLVSIIGNDLFDEDYDLALKTKCSAARALAQLIELKQSRKDLKFVEDGRRQMEEMLHRGGLGGNVRLTAGSRTEAAEERKITELRLENRARMQFWSEAFAGGWGARVTQHGSRLQDVVSHVGILGVAHLVEDRDADLRILVRRLVSSLGRMPVFEAVFGNWVSEVHLLGDDRVSADDSVEGEWKVPPTVQVVGSAVTSLAQRCAVGHVQAVIQGLETRARAWLTHSKDIATVRDGLLIYSHVLCVSAQLHGLRRGGSNAGWLQGWLVPITLAVQKLQRRSWQGRTAELGGTLSWVQERVMGALGTVEQSGRDLETRICVVRMLNSFAHGESKLGGFWRRGHVEIATGTGLGRAEERRRFERNVREWQKVLFHSAVDDPLRGGNAGRPYVEIGYVLGRLVEALESFCADRERCAVLIWQARQVYARVMGGDLVGTLTGHVRLSLIWAKVERLIALTG